MVFKAFRLRRLCGASGPIADPGPAIKIVDDAPGYLHDFHMGYRFFGVEDPDLENCAENVPDFRLTLPCAP